jgi:two-component system LytT family response regulator
MNSSFLASQKISFPFKGGQHLISPHQIIRIEANSNYSIIHATGQRPIMMAKVLSAYESILSPFGFIRTHKSHLINPDYVGQMDHGVIRMKDESEVLISRRKRNELFKHTISL